MHDVARYEVVIAGGGPVGLMLAAELRLYGVGTLVIERLTEIDATAKAGSITTPTAAAFHWRGMLPALAEVQRGIHEKMFGFVTQRLSETSKGAPPRGRMAGHFGGLMSLDLDRLDPADPDFSGGPESTVNLVPQQDIERILAERVAELGGTVWRGVAVTGLCDDGGDGVDIELSDGSWVRAGWLVGCDGGRSIVRKLAGFDFPGTEPTITGHQAIVELADPEKLSLGWSRTPVGMLVYGPVPGRILTVEYDGPPADRDTPVTLAELQNSLRHVSGTDATITAVHSATRFTDNARQASSYRVGRVLLAGDAAHVHSPFGGQGLNLGIGDAVNLGWKLAAMVQGWAPENLLDTYTTERHPVGAWVLDWTRAQVALMRPDAHTGALRAVVNDLMDTTDGNTYFIKKISGAGLSYDFGGGHELVGRRLPDLQLTDGGQLAEHCATGRPLLLDLVGDIELDRLAVGWSDRVTVLRIGCPTRSTLAGLLVRPDGHIAWATETGAALDGLTDALVRWFGTPVNCYVS